MRFNGLCIQSPSSQLVKTNAIAAIGLGVPDAPTNLVFSSVTNDSITLEGNKSASDNGSSIKYYKIDVTGGIELTTYVTDTTAIFSKLTASTMYTFNIRAINSAGESDPLEDATTTLA